MSLIEGPGGGEKNKEQKQKEIERKFLISSFPDNLDQYPHEKILQGYLAITEDGTEVRLRKKDDKFFLTVKGGGGRVRDELEIEMTQDQFAAMWSSTEGKRLEKTRYMIPYKGATLELDVYGGDLEGLIVVEVEFPSEELSEKFELPAWFAEEITEDKRYKNQSLALYGDPNKKSSKKTD